MVNKEKILFIKHIREFLNLGLKDAKYIVDSKFSINFQNLPDYTFEEAKDFIINNF
jgi:ribosomal protein L7/L12